MSILKVFLFVLVAKQLCVLESFHLQMSQNPFSPKQNIQRLLVQTAKTMGAVSFLASSPVMAKTFFDTDVYGDKELKIATVNKIKQKLRNAILQDYSVAPELLKLAINDALGYNPTDESGGPDGSIQFELEKEENKGLQRAVDVIKNVQKELQRTNTVSFGDLCMFGGAEALEAVGCGRITVQVGRYDAKQGNNAQAHYVPWDSPTSSSVTTAFTSSGLDSKDIVLLIGALGEVNRVVKEALETREEGEDEEEFEPTPFVPTTFGAPSAIYGAKLGSSDFGAKYFKDILKGKIPEGDKFATILLEDANIKSMVQKYAFNEPAFIKEVGDSYTKLNLLGQAYTTRNS